MRRKFGWHGKMMQMVGVTLCIGLVGMMATVEFSRSSIPWHANKVWHYPSLFPLCTMDACFNFSRCISAKELLIYTYSPFPALQSSPWFTSDPSKACLFLFVATTQNKIQPNTLPFWNAGFNHVIMTSVDQWHQIGIHPTNIGKASILSTELHQTTYRPAFDVSMPLPALWHFPDLQIQHPLTRKYFATFKGTTYLNFGGSKYFGYEEGTLRSASAFRSLHNGKDVIVALSCRQSTNKKIRKWFPSSANNCLQDEALFDQYEYKELMNTTFGLAPAGRSPSSYRFIEILSAGAIPVLICDNYVHPFDTLVQWHRCLLQFPSEQVHRIVYVLRSMPASEVLERQKYCLFVYHEFLKDDLVLLRSIVSSLKLRFNGIIPAMLDGLHWPIYNGAPYSYSGKW